MYRCAEGCRIHLSKFSPQLLLNNATVFTVTDTQKTRAILERKMSFFLLANGNNVSQSQLWFDFILTRKELWNTFHLAIITRMNKSKESNKTENMALITLCLSFFDTESRKLSKSIDCTVFKLQASCISKLVES